MGLLTTGKSDLSISCLSLINSLRVSRTPAKSSSSQLEATECGDTRLFTKRALKVELSLRPFLSWVGHKDALGF
jgi:hypothetical protein